MTTWPPDLKHQIK